MCLCYPIELLIDHVVEFWFTHMFWTILSYSLLLNYHQSLCHTITWAVKPSEFEVFFVICTLRVCHREHATPSCQLLLHQTQGSGHWLHQLNLIRPAYQHVGNYNTHYCHNIKTKVNTHSLVDLLVFIHSPAQRAACCYPTQKCVASPALTAIPICGNSRSPKICSIIPALLTASLQWDAVREEVKISDCTV